MLPRVDRALCEEGRGIAHAVTCSGTEEEQSATRSSMVAGFFSGGSVLRETLPLQSSRTCDGPRDSAAPLYRALESGRSGVLPRDYPSTPLLVQFSWHRGCPSSAVPSLDPGQAVDTAHRRTHVDPAA